MSLLRGLTLAGTKKIALRLSDTGEIPIAIWDGSAYQRLKGNSSGIQQVNEGTVLSVTGAQAQTAGFQGVAATANRRLFLVMISESAATAAAAKVTLYVGTSTAGTYAGTINLAADDTIGFSITGGGLNIASGLWVEVNSGTIDFVAYYKDLG